MFMSVALESAVFMGKNYLDNCHSIANTKDLTLPHTARLEKRLGLQFEDYALKSIARAFASRSKAKTKTTKTYFCQLIHKNYTN